MSGYDESSPPRTDTIAEYGDGRIYEGFVTDVDTDTFPGEIQVRLEDSANAEIFWGSIDRSLVNEAELARIEEGVTVRCTGQPRTASEAPIQDITSFEFGD